jgi:very-short-patch-repair endonuclease
MPSSSRMSSSVGKRFSAAEDATSASPHPSPHPRPHPRRHRTRSPPFDQRIDAIAEVQHGVVTLQQFREAGLTRQMVWDRVRKGRFAPLHRGVYRVGPRLSARTDEMAAVLACGPTAVLSHRSAAALWNLLPSPHGRAGPPMLPVEVSICRSTRGVAATGILAHRVTTLGPGDRTIREGIPVTTPARTLLDLATLAARSPERADRRPLPPVTYRDLERAVAKAGREGLASPADLRGHLAASPRRRGAGPLRRMLDQEGGPAFTRSEAEARLLDLVRRARLPPPRTNARVGGLEVDFLWREAGLAVEVDGYAFHASLERFEGDRVRDADLAARGILVIRVTWRQIRDEPAAVIGRVARALGRAEARAATP